MKKIMMLAGFAFSIVFAACGQKLKEADVPAAVKSSFTKQFPGVSAKWEKEDGKYEAGFKKDGSAMSALFLPDGKMTESEMDIKIAALPANVLDYIKENYKGKTIKEAAMITMADGTVNYEAEVNGKDVIFDSNGIFIKEAKD